MKKCGQCGEMNGNGAEVCFKCQAPLSAVSDNASTESAERTSYGKQPIIQTTDYVSVPQKCLIVLCFLVIAAVFLPWYSSQKGVLTVTPGAMMPLQSSTWGSASSLFNRGGFVLIILAVVNVIFAAKRKPTLSYLATAGMVWFTMAAFSGTARLQYIDSSTGYATHYEIGVYVVFALLALLILLSVADVILRAIAVKKST